MSRAGTRATCLSAGSGVRLLECRVWSSPSRSACRASSGRVLPPPAPWIRTRVLPRTRPSCRSALECCLQRDPLAVDLLSPTKIGSRCYRQERSRRRAVEQGEPEGWRQDPRGGESAGERQGARLPRPPDRGDKRRPCGTTPRRPSRARRAPCTIAPARPGTTGSTAPPGTRPPLPERTHHSALARRDHHVLDVERGELAKPKRRVVQQCHDRPVRRTHQLGRPQQRACSSVDSARGAACANGSRLTFAGPRPTNRVKWSTAASARFTDTGFHPRSTFRCRLKRVADRERRLGSSGQIDGGRARGSGASPRTANLFLARVRHRDPSSSWFGCLQAAKRERHATRDGCATTPRRPRGYRVIQGAARAGPHRCHGWPGESYDLGRRERPDWVENSGRTSFSGFRCNARFHPPRVAARPGKLGGK